MRRAGVRGRMDPQAEAKRAAAEAACELVKDGMTVGLGTGSTAVFAVRRLGEMHAKGTRIRGVPTSEATATLAREVGIPLVDVNDVETIDVTLDGADEVAPRFDLIKGLGGALLREKIVASLSQKVCIMVDPTKIVAKLGTRSPLPVEVVPFGWKTVERRLLREGMRPQLRTKDGKPVLTDNGNHVLDVHFPNGIEGARVLEEHINNIPGVVENGLFVALATHVVVGEASGPRWLEKPKVPGATPAKDKLAPDDPITLSKLAKGRGH